jgi:hypothetical protein
MQISTPAFGLINLRIILTFIFHLRVCPPQIVAARL